MRPGVVTTDEAGQFQCSPIYSTIVSLFAEEKEVHTSRIIPAALIGFTFHMFVTLWVKNESFEYVIKSSSSSWLQEHIFDISET